MKDNSRIKKYGEVFTPEKLAREMMETIPSEFWKIQEHTVMEPSFGRGVFLDLIFEYKLKNGSTLEQCVETVFGIELLNDNVEYTHNFLINKYNIPDNLQYLLKKNIKQGNFLDEI